MSPTKCRLSGFDISIEHFFIWVWNFCLFYTKTSITSVKFDQSGCLTLHFVTFLKPFLRHFLVWDEIKMCQSYSGFMIFDVIIPSKFEFRITRVPEDLESSYLAQMLVLYGGTTPENLSHFGEVDARWVWLLGGLPLKLCFAISLIVDLIQKKYLVIYTFKSL